jgi:hypothetical protein
MYYKQLKQLYNYTNTISCVYLFNFGNIYNNYILCKYGYTNNLLRRFREHERDYNLNRIELLHYVQINNSNLRNAENDFRNELKKLDVINSMYINDKRRRELFIIKENNVFYFKQLLNNIHSSYK